MGRDEQPGPDGVERVHENFPSRVAKWVGLPRVSPPAATHAAVHSTTCASGSVGYPSSWLAREALDSNAVGASSPTIRGFLSSSSPNRYASQRTDTVSGPVRLRTVDGTSASLSARSVAALTSPCQMTLTAPVVTSISCASRTAAASSSSTPYRISTAC